MEALNSGRLEVPERVRRLERELAAEWERRCKGLRKGGGKGAKKKGVGGVDVGVGVAAVRDGVNVSGKY